MPSAIFLVFVQGKPGHKADYAKWFAGPHRQDMERLEGVLSARTFRLQSLDDKPIPAELCAIYEAGNGAGLLDAIGKAKGTAALPDSPIQGEMSWRLFDVVEGSGLPMESALAILLYPAGEMPELPLGATLARLSPLQSRRGREYGHAVFVGVDSAEQAAKLAETHGTDGTRILLALP